MLSRFLVVGLAFAFIFGCSESFEDSSSNDQFDKSELAGVDGKFDSSAEARICRSHGFPADCDVCDSEGSGSTPVSQRNNVLLPQP